MKWFKRKKVDVPTEYKFTTTEVTCSGDKYEYTVKANNREEAFKKLVEWFFVKGGPHGEDIEQDHYDVSVPSNYRFYTEGMPKWFGRCISGHKGDHYKTLDQYAKENGITLRND